MCDYKGKPRKAIANKNKLLMTGLSKMGHINLLLAMPLFYMTEKDSPSIQRRSLKLEPAEKRSTYIK